MSLRRTAAVALALALLVAPTAPEASAAPPEPVDLEMVTRIRDEAFNRSKAFETLSKLCDGVGPRLTGSPDYRKAAEWAKAELEKLGLSNARIETFAPFGRGWTLESSSFKCSRRLSRRSLPSEGVTPGTDGTKKGKALLAKLETQEDLDKWKGKLEGKILLLGDPPEAKPAVKGDVSRYDDKALEEIWRYEPGGGRYRRSPADRERMLSSASSGRRSRPSSSPRKWSPSSSRPAANTGRSGCRAAGRGRPESRSRPRRSPSSPRPTAASRGFSGGRRTWSWRST